MGVCLGPGVNITKCWWRFHNGRIAAKVNTTPLTGNINEAGSPDTMKKPS